MTDTYDAVVIGAGIAGISAALHLQRAGLTVVHLERHTRGSGASSRNAGFLMRGAADNYAACVRDHGRPHARFLWKLSEDNLTALRAEGIHSIPSFADRPSCLLALDEEEADELRRSADLLRADGLAVDTTTDTLDAARRLAPRFALINPNDGCVNPVELLRHLAAKLQSPPIENAEVHTIEPARNHVVVRTPTLTLRADRAIVCTNAYAPLLLPRLRELITPNRGQMLALRSDAPILRSYYANHGGEYFRRADNSTIVFGGWRRFDEANERTYADSTSDAIQRGLESFASRVLGTQPLEVIARWSGTMGFTPDHLPIADALDDDRRLWFCGGFSGQGMSMGFKTAALAVESMLKGTPTAFPLSRFQA